MQDASVMCFPPIVVPSQCILVSPHFFRLKLEFPILHIIKKLPSIKWVKYFYFKSSPTSSSDEIFGTDLFVRLQKGNLNDRFSSLPVICIADVGL